MERLLTAMAVFSFGLLAAVLFSLRRERIRAEYSVSWLAAALVLLGLSRMGGAIETIAEMLGISYPPVALLMLIFGVFLVVFYRFSILISQLKDANVALTQKLAILESHVERQGAAVSALARD
jgi:hypothetical protein